MDQITNNKTKKTMKYFAIYDKGNESYLMNEKGLLIIFDDYEEALIQTYKNEEVRECYIHSARNIKQQ